MKHQLITLLSAAALTLGAAAPETFAAKRVHTIGDSTMANYDESATVTRGWCQYLQLFLDGIEVNNRGKSGSSSKSFYHEAPYWTTVKQQMQPGDYVLIQFAHNDEKTQGMDGDEVKAYYSSIGDDAKASSTDYRGTHPGTTYKEYLRKYVNETREAGCTPILVGPVCRMYFSGNTIRRNGQHDLGDSFSKLTESGILTDQSVPASDNSMDYVWQMQQVAQEMDVPFVNLTTATAELYLSYGQTDCMDILSDGDGSTHLSATGATLIARKFVGLAKEQGLFTEYANLKADLSASPENADLGRGYLNQTLSKEIMVTGFDLTPASGTVTITPSANVTVSATSLPYEGGTLIGRFNASMTLDKEGVNEGTVTITSGDKTCTVNLTANAVQLAGGTEVTAYWRLEKDDSYQLTGPAVAIPESWHGMELQRYSNPNANTVWPDWTGFDAKRKTQRNLIEGGEWPAGEIDEVSTRYIEFGLTAMTGTTLNIDEISYFVCGCGGNGMCLHVWYSAEDDFSNATLIFSQTKLPANNMIDGKVTPVLSLPEGKSVRLRFYPWYNGAATGKTLCLSDIKIHGYATTGESALDIVKASETVETTYYNMQGIRIDNPAKGQICIEQTVLADGTRQARKIVK